MAPTRGSAKNASSSSSKASASADDTTTTTKLTADQSSALVLEYLRKQNRPYSATDISANLKNRVTKAAAVKLLKELHDNGEIEGRTQGKQVVYHAVQEEPSTTSAEDLKAIETSTTQLREATASLKAEEKTLRAALREEASIIPISQLKDEIILLEAELEQHEARLQESRRQKAQAKVMTDEEKDAVVAEYKKYERAAIARKKICTEVWAEVVEMLGGEKAKVKEVKGELGLEFFAMK